MLATGAILDSTIVSIRPMDVAPTGRSSSTGTTTIMISAPDDRELFKVKTF
jgi:hypothetical protein